MTEGIKQVIGSFEDYTPEQQEAVRKLLNSTDPYKIVRGMIGLTPIQRAILNHAIDMGFDEYDGYGYIANCSRGLGKTFLSTCWAMLVLLISKIYYERKPEHKNLWIGKNRMTRPVFRIVSNTKEEMNSNIQDVVALALGMFPPEIIDARNSWHVSGSYFQLNYGARIVFKGMERNENSGRGSTAAGYSWDEMGTSPLVKTQIESVINASVTRSKRVVHPSHHCVIGRWIGTTTPPDTIESEFTDLYLELEFKGRTANYTIFDAYPTTTLKEIVGYFNTSSYSAFLREYMCKMIPDAERAIVPEFKKEVHVAKYSTVPFKHLMHKYRAIDLGATDKTVVAFAYVNPVIKKLVVEDEIVFQDRQLTPETIGKSIQAKDKEIDYVTYHKERCDTNEPIMINGLNKDYGFNFVGIEKAELKVMVGQLRDMFTNEQIIIHPRCTEIISCLLNGMWDKKKKKFSKNVRLGHYDALAALIYLARDVDLDINPLPTQVPGNVFAMEREIPGDSGLSEIAKLFNIPLEEGLEGNKEWMM